MTPGLRRDLLRWGVLPCTLVSLLLAVALGVVSGDWRLALAAILIALTAAACSLRWLTRRVVEPARELADKANHGADSHHTHELRQIRAGIEALDQSVARERKDADRRVRSSVAEALQRWSEAQAAHHGKAQFLAAVGDRLRQPLYAMGLFIGALQRDATPAQRVSIERLQGVADGMGGLLEELLEIARLDARVIEVRPRTLELRDFFALQAPALQDRARMHRVELGWLDAGLVLHADPVLLGRVLHHLVSNAIEHAPGGRVMVAARRCGDQVRLQVRDNGGGIARIHQERIFDEFFQLGDDRRERRLGLGLPICARLAALLGGHIEVRSELGRGSVFSIDLPRAVAVMPRRPRHAVRSDLPADSQSRRQASL